MSELHFQPIKGQARKILKAILDSPEISSCRMKETLTLRLACEEIVVIRFEDGGVPFNPLEHKNPDVTLPWKQRRIGGLGIFLLRRKMDDIHYDHIDNKNILTIEKVIQKLS